MTEREANGDLYDGPEAHDVIGKAICVALGQERQLSCDRVDELTVINFELTIGFDQRPKFDDFLRSEIRAGWFYKFAGHVWFG